MEDKQLDLDAPLLSTRRFAAESDPSATRNPNQIRSTLPFYKSDLKTGPIRRPGVVPFIWEQTPGRPKLPPGRISNPKEADNSNTHGNEEETEERFSDALETFSMSCSVSGMSVMTDRVEGSGSFSNDPHVRDFMMGRFLPAAKAMATESTHASSLRKPREPMRTIERVENGGQGQIRYPMSYQHDVGTRYSYDDDEDDEYEEEDRYGNGNLLSKGCGLIPKFCLLNPVPGIKVSGRGLVPTSVRRNRSPQVKATQLGSVGQVEEEYSWEAVYKHKQMHGNPSFQREDNSKLTSESNHLTYLSDSLTPDGPSPQRCCVGGISPYRNEPSQSPFHEGKGFLGVPRTDQKGSKTDGSGSGSFERDSENNWIATSHHSSQRVSSSASPAVDRTLHVDTVHMSETLNSKSSSLRSFSDNKDITKEDSEAGVESDGMDESHRMDPEVGVESNRMNGSLIAETRDIDVLQSCAAIDVNNGFEPNDIDENNQVKNDADPVRSLLPPPLPNSPSESWLNRTLPSISSKNPSAQSFLGIHLQPRKQSSTPSLVISKEEITAKASKVHRSKTRFADMLAKPLSPKSEI